jgi:superfamily II DNA helicase RecQ
MALTATATPRVQHDVVQQLCLRRCVIFRSSFNRANLRWADLLLFGTVITQHHCWLRSYFCQ